MRKLAAWVPAAAVVAVLGLLMGLGTVSQEAEDQVYVMNWPETQNVKGSVSIEGIPAHATLVRKEGVNVPPVRRADTAALVPAGSVNTDGFTQVVLSLNGEMKDSAFAPGTVGAVLVPAEDPVMRAFNYGRKIQFPLEVPVQITAGEGAYFSSEPVKLPVGFSSYNVFFYNTTGKGCEANLYLYLTN
jgi:hypothetical protein